MRKMTRGSEQDAVLKLWPERKREKVAGLEVVEGKGETTPEGLGCRLGFSGSRVPNCINLDGDHATSANSHVPQH